MKKCIWFLQKNSAVFKLIIGVLLIYVYASQMGYSTLRTICKYGIIVLLFLLFLLIVREIAAVKLENKYFLKADIRTIDKLDGIAFERYLAAHFRSKGYKVTVTPPEKDFGVDLILEKDHEKIAVQAKRYKRDVSYTAIQEVVAGKSMYDCNKAMVITNSYFTKAGKELAKKNDVELWDRNMLIKTFSIENAPQPKDYWM